MPPRNPMDCTEQADGLKRLQFKGRRDAMAFTAFDTAVCKQVLMAELLRFLQAVSRAGYANTRVP